MKSDEQVLTQWALSEISFDCGHGPDLLNRAEMNAIYTGIVDMPGLLAGDSLTIISKEDGVERVRRTFEPPVLDTLRYHYRGGIYGRFAFRDFLHYEGLSEIMEEAPKKIEWDSVSIGR